MKKFLALALFLCGATLHASNYVLPNANSGCPSNCRQIPWVTGSDIWNSGTLPVYTGVTCTGLHNNGSTDDGAVIQACINALSTNQCAVIPAGTNYYINSTVALKSHTCVRGAQAEGGPPFLPTAQSGETRLILGSSGQLTTQDFSFTSGSLTPATNYNTLPSTYTLTGTPQKGDTSLTIGSGSVSIGTWIIVYGNDDPSLVTTTGEDGHCNWCGMNTGFYAQAQIVQVTGFTSGSGGAGSVVTISKPLYYTPDVTSRVVAGPDGSGTVTEPAGPKYTIINFGTVQAGYEDLRISGAVHDIGSTQIILMQGCLECWVKNIETYDTGSNSESAHVELQMSYGNEVRDSAFHDERSGASGSGYGFYTQFTNTDHKIENNIFYHNRHWIVFQGGGSGYAVLYNYADDGYTDDLTYFASGRTSHGAHPFSNLFEGNIVMHLTADDFSGTSSHDVLFRNWFRGGEPNTDLGSGTIPSFPPAEGFDAIDLYPGQTYYSFVDNVLGNPGLGSGISGTWSAATVSGFDEYAVPATPLVYSYGGVLGSTASSATTIIRQGNYDYKTLGVAYNDGGTGYSYQPSYYYSSKPSFLGTCAFPAQGSDLSTKGSLSQAAYQRAMSGSCGLAPSPPTGLTGSVVISGGVQIQ
jgi:hypothetical protein